MGHNDLVVLAGHDYAAAIANWLRSLPPVPGV
jgi:hypothetical protein